MHNYKKVIDLSNELIASVENHNGFLMQQTIEALDLAYKDEFGDSLDCYDAIKAFVLMNLASAKYFSFNNMFSLTHLRYNDVAERMDGFLKTGSSCTKCPNHCFDCTNSTECKTCSSGYFLTANKTCYKYDCSGDYFCLLTNDRDNVLSVYKYNFGDNPAFSITPDLGIKTCYMGDTKCAYGGTTPTCWLPNMLTGNYASTVATCATASKAQNYDRCNRVACNFHAYIKVAQKYKTSGLRFANYSDMNELKNLFFGNRAFEQTGAPFLVGITNDNSTIVTRATHQCYNQGMNDEPCWIAHRICFSSDGGAHYALFREPTARDKWAFNNPIPVWAYGLDDSYNFDLSTYKGYAEGALFVK